MHNEKDIYTAALNVIDKCDGQHNPKKYVLFLAKKSFERDENDDAIRWHQIAKMIDKLLNKDSEKLIH